MSNDMKEYMGSKVKLKRHLVYLIKEASDPEIVGSENDIQKYEILSYKQVLKKASVDVVAELRAIQAKLYECQKYLDIGFVNHNIECDINKPISTLYTISDISVGDDIYALAVDSVREKLVVRRWDTTAPITVYDFQGQQLQVLGKDVEGIAGSSEQGIAIDTKPDLYILPMTNRSLVTMDMNGDGALHGVSYSETDRYVTSSANTKQVYIINPRNKQILTTTVTLSYPYNGHCGSITCKGEATPVIVVSNYSSDCIKVLDMSGHLLHTYGKEGKAGQGDEESEDEESEDEEQGYGELNGPEGVCIDPGGRIIVCDSLNNRMVSFWSEGNTSSREQITWR